MGLSFHYKGRLKEAPTLPLLIEEVEDICKTLGWKANVLETKFPKDIFQNNKGHDDFGIIFNPTECEPIPLVFNYEGRLVNPSFRKLLHDETKGNIKVITVKLDLNDENPEPVFLENDDDFDPIDFTYSISVKTAYGDSKNHIQIIELIRYLSEKYLSDFELMDETKYWETKDLVDLNETMDGLNNIIDVFNNMIKEKSINNPKEFLTLIRMLKSHFKKDKEDDSSPI